MTNTSIKRVLTIKERMRTVRRSELAEAAKKVQSAEEKANRAALLRKRAIESVTTIGEISARDLAGRSKLVAQATSEEKKARNDLNERVEEKNNRTTELQEADREVRTFNVLQQRIQQRDIREELANEQKETDEAAARTRTTDET
jgi:flagellar export protein FliJ